MSVDDLLHGRGTVRVKRPHVSLIYTWSDGGFTQLMVPGASDFASNLTSVSCQSSSFCVPVGPDLQLMWNGSTFTGESFPINQGLSPFFVGPWESVSCAPAQAFCTEVGCQPVFGGTNAPVAESYVNRQWIVQSKSNDYSGKFVVGPSNARSATLTGVFCITAQSCQAVGIHQNAGTRAAGIWGAALKTRAGTTSIAAVSQTLIRTPPVAKASVRKPLGMLPSTRGRQDWKSLGAGRVSSGIASTCTRARRTFGRPTNHSTSNVTAGDERGRA